MRHLLRCQFRAPTYPNNRPKQPPDGVRTCRLVFLAETATIYTPEFGFIRRYQRPWARSADLGRKPNDLSLIELSKKCLSKKWDEGTLGGSCASKDELGMIHRR
jgi:hypothetical protein